MRTALISDNVITIDKLSPIFRIMDKFEIRFDPIIKLPLPKNANVCEYISSLRINNSYEEIKDCRAEFDKPDVIIYLAGKYKKYLEYIKRYFNKNVKILYIKIDECGNILKNDQIGI